MQDNPKLDKAARLLAWADEILMPPLLSLQEIPLARRYVQEAREILQAEMSRAET